MNIEEKIETKIKENLLTSYFKIINESHLHSSSDNKQSHFKVIMVSEEFDNISLLERHQKIFALLTEELKNIHALSLKLYSVQEWEQSQLVPKSPPCSKS